MVLLDKMWDDVLAGPQPERGLGKLRKITTQPLSIKDDGEGKRFRRSLSMPMSPGAPPTPVTPTTPTPRKENVWRSVFHPWSNLATKSIGADMFHRPQPNSPTVYDWLYSGETRSKHR
ncbi:auxin-repressed 12.5 kDa protein-like isoform X2 [Hibiscus syriacus]|uniref:auxin-repressed 12.5 kDa protein-like isoform X2 n=1 Tax=Hibiscus syriacus TaxID=106335 RepID=UPI001920652A|nr:auxin-repressed 12.5 kDa protein-like isoform X2 [Hibiscus syriacus]